MLVILNHMVARIPFFPSCLIKTDESLLSTVSSAFGSVFVLTIYQLFTSGRQFCCSVFNLEHNLICCNSAKMTVNSMMLS